MQFIKIFWLKSAWKYARLVNIPILLLLIPQTIFSLICELLPGKVSLMVIWELSFEAGWLYMKCHICNKFLPDSLNMDAAFSVSQSVV